MVLEDAGAVCLRCKALGGRRATVKWNARLSDSLDVVHKGDAESLPMSDATPQNGHLQGRENMRGEEEVGEEE